MIKLPKTSSSRSLLSRVAFATLGLVFVASLSGLPAVQAAETPSTAKHAEKTLPVPLAVTFEKVKDSEKGPNLLHLKNTSDKTIKASAKILLAVAFHADSKARMVPEEKVEAGKTWTISGLAAGDKVIVTAHGFAPLELLVP